MNEVRGVVLALVSLAVAGCGGPSPGESQADGQQTGDVFTRAGQALDKATADTQRRAEAEMEKVLAAVQVQLDELGRKVADASEEVHDRVWEQMRVELENKQAQVREQLSKLKENSGAAGEELTRGISKAMEDLREAMARAAAALQQDSAPDRPPAEAPPDAKEGTAGQTTG